MLHAIFKSQHEFFDIILLVLTYNFPVYAQTDWIDITPPGPGNTDCSMRNASTSLAAWRPSVIAHTTNDWPRRQSKK